MPSSDSGHHSDPYYQQGSGAMPPPPEERPSENAPREPSEQGYAAMPPPPPPPRQPHGGGRYGAMPPAPGGYGGRPSAPREVQAAFWCFLLSAVIVVISALLVLGQRDRLAEAARQAAKAQAQPFTQAQLDQAVNIVMGAYVVVGVIIALLYALFAFKARAGRNWARIVLAVIAVLALIGLLAGNASILSVVGRALAVASAVLLYVPNSNAFFQSGKRLR